MLSRILKYIIRILWLFIKYIFNVLPASDGVNKLIILNIGDSGVCCDGDISSSGYIFRITVLFPILIFCRMFFIYLVISLFGCSLYLVYSIYLVRFTRSKYICRIRLFTLPKLTASVIFSFENIMIQISRGISVIFCVWVVDMLMLLICYVYCVQFYNLYANMTILL